MDINYLLWLQKIREAAGPVLEVLMYGITMAAVIGIAISFVIYLCVDKEKGFHAVMAFMIGNVIAQFLKNIFCINRPWIRDSRVQPSRLGLSGATGYSFPSGHSNAAASSYGGLAYQYRQKKGLCIFLIIFILLAGFSRNYLGVHTPQDVVVGLLIGFGSIYLGETGIRAYHKHKYKDKTWIVVILIVTAALCAFTVMKSYPMVYKDGILVVDPLRMQRDALQGYGMTSSFLIGSILERKYVNFTTDHIRVKTKVLRGISCLILVGAVYLLFHNGLIHVMEQRLCYFLMGFCMMIITSFLMPYLFGVFERKRRNS